MNTGTIVENKQLVEGLNKTTIEIKTGCGFTHPGQYAIITIPGKELERAYSVCEYDSKRFTVVYRTSNTVSETLAKMEVGSEVTAETGLGNGFNTDIIPSGVTLVADTDGIPQMLGLLRELLMQGKTCSLVLGYSTKDRVYMRDVFGNLCSNIEIFTADGSNGRQGRADDGVRSAEYVCAAGSVEMLDRLAKKAEHGQYNLDGMNITAW